MLNFSNLNYLIIFITTIITFGIGAAWYTALFGKTWQKETGLSDKIIDSGNPAVTYGGSFVAFFFLNVFVAMLLKNLAPSDWISGAMIGLAVGLLVNASTLAINNLYQMKTLKLWLIDAGYNVIIMTVAGIIMTVWK
jgi:Protein of unknown function (DUF1761)